MAIGKSYPHVEYYLRKYFNNQNKVLEVSCGAAVYRNLFPKNQYVGTDVYNSHYQDKDSVDVYSSADQIPFVGVSFDLIFSQAAIDYIDDLDSMLEEFKRILRPNGNILIFTYSKSTLERIHRAAKNPKTPAFTHHHVFSERDLISLFDSHGFVVKQLPYVLAPKATFYSRITKVGVVQLILKRFTVWRTFVAQAKERFD